MMRPDECESIQDVRAEIDRIDADIIAALGERYQYVKAASSFKTSEGDVRAPDRFKSLIEARREWAEEAGLDPDAIETMYRNLVDYFTRAEMEEWQQH